MSLLSQPYSAHGVDVEGLARQVLKNWLQQKGAYLDPAKEEDAIAFLISTIWMLSTRYDRTRSTLAFSTYAYRITFRRVTDFYRSQFGDRRYGQAVIPETLEGRDDVADEGSGFDEALVSINVKYLTPIARRTLVKIARPKSEEGLTIEELAQRFGYRRREITQRLAALKSELQDLGVVVAA